MLLAWLKVTGLLNVLCPALIMWKEASENEHLAEKLPGFEKEFARVMVVLFILV